MNWTSIAIVCGTIVSGCVAGGTMATFLPMTKRDKDGKVTELPTMEKYHRGSVLGGISTLCSIIGGSITLAVAERFVRA